VTYHPTTRSAERPVCFSSGFSVLPIRPTAVGRSLRYHRLHPEYIHQRIEHLGLAYNLIILLLMCEIVRRARLTPTHSAHPLAPQSEHQDPIRELTKVCLLNNVTVIVAWSYAASHQTTESHTYTIPLAHIRARAAQTRQSNISQHTNSPSTAYP